MSTIRGPRPDPNSLSTAAEATAGARDMEAFEIYIDDQRYSVPTLYLMAETDEASALRAAYDRFAESDHHSGVELWRGDRRVLALGSAVRRTDS